MNDADKPVREEEKGVCRCPTCGAIRKKPTGNPTGRPRQPLEPRSFGSWVLHIYAPSSTVGRGFKSIFKLDPWSDRPMRANYIFTVRDWMKAHPAVCPANKVQRFAAQIWDSYCDYKKRLEELNQAS